MDDDILDYAEKKPRRSPVVIVLFTLAIALFAYWFMADFFRWNYSGWALLMGLVSLLLIILIRFRNDKQRNLYAYFYLLGKISLLIAIYMNFLNIGRGFIPIYIAFGCFATGVYLIHFHKSPS